MGYYNIETFKKNKTGKWIKTKSDIAKEPYEYGRWIRSRELDEKDNTTKTYFQTERTKTGINKKVVSAVSYFNKGQEKVVRKLITTSNKLPKKI